jgi:heat shock protein HtpX
VESTKPIEPGASCPECGTGTVTERAATPWCPACEWNLDAPEPRWWDVELGTPRMRRRLERRTRRNHAMAYRMARDQYRSLLGRPLGRSGPAGDRVVLVAVSVLLLAIPVGCLLLAAWLFTHWPFLPALVVGGLLASLAVILRPRFPRLDVGTSVLRRADAPELYALVDEVTAAAGCGC